VTPFANGTAPVTVVMAAMDAEQFIADAIRSALDQSLPPERVVVVDDGSSDGTADRAEAVDPRVTVLRRAHAGAGPSRNAGIAATDTELVAFLDADDLWRPRKLELQVAALAAHPHLDAVFCLMDEFLDAAAEATGTRAPRTGVAVPLSGATLVRRGLVERLGPFEDDPVGDWVRWWARARAIDVEEHFVPEVLFLRRIHGRNNSATHADAHGEALLGIARAHLRQRRAGAGDGGSAGGSDGAGAAPA